jgi:intracellular septation protein A
MVQQARAPLAPGRIDDLPDPTWRSLLRRGLPQFGGEAIAPVLVFYAAWKLWGLAPAIAASSVVYLALAAWLIRRGREVGLVAVGAVFVVVQALVGLASRSATLYLAQPVVLSALWGLAYFASVAIGRPLIGVFANAWYPFPAWFRASTPYRREFAMQSIVWGVYCLARAAFRLWVLLESGITGFLVVSILTGTPLLVALIGWGIWHARRAFSRLEFGMPPVSTEYVPAGEGDDKGARR